MISKVTPSISKTSSVMYFIFSTFQLWSDWIVSFRPKNLPRNGYYLWTLIGCKRVAGKVPQNKISLKSCPYYFRKWWESSLWLLILSSDFWPHNTIIIIRIIIISIVKRNYYSNYHEWKEKAYMWPTLSRYTLT